MSASEPKFAVLFDWDGVVVDSSKHHEESWELLAAEESAPLPPDHFKRGFGMKNEIIIPNLLGWTTDTAEIRRLSLRKEALYREVVARRGLAPLVGVADLLAALAEQGIPRVIGSSTHLLNIETGLKACGLVNAFSGMVTAEDVSHGKPDPEVFLRAATLAGLPPGRCVVLEDALVGIEAARAGGMKVVAIATTNPPELLRAADLVVPLPSALTPSLLGSLFDNPTAP